MWQKAWRFRALCTLPIARFVAIIARLFCVVACLAHCAILTTLFSSCIVETTELVAGFHESWIPIHIILPIMHVPAKTIDTPGEALAFIFSVCRVVWAPSLYHRDFSIILWNITYKHTPNSLCRLKSRESLMCLLSGDCHNDENTFNLR